MSEYKTINEIIKQIKTSKPYLTLPLGYVNGYPVLTLKNDRICAVIPYLKYKKTGEVDKTQVYPIRYLITYAIKDGVIVALEDLKNSEMFRDFDFEKPVGLFRHDAIKELTKDEYTKKQQQLYALYDSFAEALIDKKDYPLQNIRNMKSLLSTLLEPSLKPFYKTLYPNFYKNCIE